MLGLEVVDGAAVGAWIEPRLGGEFGAVTLQVPKGFEAYARVFHPASNPEGKPVSWAEVASALGRTAHREMQWHALVGSSDTFNFTGSEWEGGNPSLGEMDEPELDGLCEVLAAHTADPALCFFGVCVISAWTWIEGVLSAEEKRLPQLRLPMERDHVVLAGPLSAAAQIGHSVSERTDTMTFVAIGTEAPPETDHPDYFWRHSPNLIWPADRAWCVASEVDFDSTLVGGSVELIEAIVNAPDLEAWQVEPDDSLAADADKVNLVAEGET